MNIKAVGSIIKSVEAHLCSELFKYNDYAVGFDSFEAGFPKSFFFSFSIITMKTDIKTTVSLCLIKDTSLYR